jgi:hypothetical protein
MPLIITNLDILHNDERQVIEWDIMNDDRPKLHNVIELRASGVELDYIRFSFVGVPVHMLMTEVVWKAPFAQFIVDNL